MTKKERNYHIIGWALYWAYVIIGEYMDPSVGHNLKFIYSFIFVKMIEFYVCYLWVFPKFLNKGKIPQLIGGIAVATASFIASRYLIEQVLYNILFHIQNYDAGVKLSYYITDNLYYGSSAIILSAAIYLGFDSLKKSEENRSLREEKVQAELAFLKTQINPHFLYNTLNYIYSLAYPVSEELAGAVVKLSQLMRYMLTESADGAVDLQKEVEYIHNYISIFKMRFEDHFFVDFDIDGGIAGKRIASLILVPFVENAFKHGVVNDPAQPIEINLKVTGNQLLFIVNNEINKQEKDHSTGIGLPNIRRRLELIYPNRHELKISSAEETYSVTLCIDL
ncbi:histidine kinase [Mucilaginibacter sp. dw_454]|uniref:sensor histidine kinase n=1 Tax=Mucilaginibacter sp. dw_454 TaxID=2720079 RepID=UPI001BD399D9|nr:histidine kinase [Mucilaginibacter sp. dw_454]